MSGGDRWLGMGFLNHQRYLPISITWLGSPSWMNGWLQAPGAMNVPHLPETNQHTLPLNLLGCPRKLVKG